MHIESTLISTAVAGAAAISQGATLSYTINKTKKEFDKDKMIKMSLAGAFVFAAQMINISIPGTGSSGHIAGGILLSGLLGGPAAFITMAIILTIQAVFFGDGGLLVLGLNILNLGFIPCIVAYPLLSKLFSRIVSNPKKKVIMIGFFASIIAAIAGAVAVVVETSLSGIGGLQILEFLLRMTSIHFIIGLAEGVITAGILALLYEANMTLVTSFLGALSSIAAAVLSVYSSSKPDGLEWSISNVSSVENLAHTDKAHEIFHQIQTVFTQLSADRRGAMLGTLLCGAIVYSMGFLLWKKQMNSQHKSSKA